MKNRTAVILCGGKGSRLGSIAKKIPKTLVKIHSKPILWYILKNLKLNKINHVILPVGYKGNLIQYYVKKNLNQFKGLKIEIVKTGIHSSIASRIYKIKNYILSENFLLLNGDAVFDFNIYELFKKHEQKKTDITFLGNPAQLPYGVVVFKKNKITNFKREIIFNSVKKNDNKNFIGYVYSGIAIINKKIMSLTFKNYKNFEKEFYPIIIKNFKASFSHIKGKWFSIDNQKDINFLNKKNNYSFKIVKNIFKKLNEK